MTQTDQTMRDERRADDTDAALAVVRLGPEHPVVKLGVLSDAVDCAKLMLVRGHT